MFSRLIRSLHSKAVVIKVSYVKVYNFFGSVQYCLFQPKCTVRAV